MSAFRSYDSYEPSPIRSYTDVHLSKEAEQIHDKVVQLPGMDHPIQLKIHASQTIDDGRINEAIQKNMDALKSVIAEFGGPQESLTLKLSNSGELNIHLSADNLVESEKIRTVFNRVKSPISAKPDDKLHPDKVISIDVNLQTLFQGQKFVLTESKVKEIADAILEHGDYALKMAQKTQQKVLINTDQPHIQLVASKSGALYVRVSFLGKGGFKETLLFAKVGKLVGKEIKESEAKQSAVSVAKPDPVVLQDAEFKKAAEEEFANEVLLHQDLSALRQAAKKGGQPDPLPHVATAKVVTDLTQGKGAALMGTAYKGGNVNERIIQGTLSDSDKARICAGFLKGLGELHGLNIVHRDIKADNILLDTEVIDVPSDKWPQKMTSAKIPEGYSVEWENGEIKSVKQTVIKALLCDLGKGSHLDPEKRFHTSHLFKNVMPPGRYLKNDQFTRELDIYSAGRTAYQIFAGVPVDKFNDLERSSPLRRTIVAQINKVQKQIETTQDSAALAGLQEELRKLDQQLIDFDVESRGAPEKWEGWNNIPPKVQDFIKKMVDKDLKQRPTVEACTAFFESLTPEELQARTPSQEVTKPVVANQPGGYGLGYNVADAS